MNKALAPMRQEGPTTPIAAPVVEVTEAFPRPLNPDPTPKRRLEGFSQYLQRSSDAVATAVRELLNRWIGMYPQKDRGQLIPRLRDHKQFDSAFFELFMHELLLKLGYEIDVHLLEGNDTERRPDFLLRGPVSRAYLEATLATCMPDSLRSALARKGSVLDALFDVGSVDFIVHSEERESPRVFERSPKGKALKDKLQSWLDSLNWDQCWPLMEHWGLERLPRYDASPMGVCCTFIAIPRPAELRGQVNASGIVSEISEIEMNPVGSLRAAVRKKAGRYGQMSHPYVVAVSVLRAPWDQYVIDEALFGASASRLRLTDEGGEQEERFRVGGVWLEEGSPRNTRVSAVLLAFGLDPTTVAADGMKMALYHNPWAQRPYDGPLCRLPQAKLQDGRWVSVPGAVPRDILGLKEAWLGRL